MNAREWFGAELERLKGDPEFVAEEMVVQVIADLCRAMKEQKLSKKELATRLKASPAFVSQVLNGKPNLTLLTLAKFAVALDLDCRVQLTTKTLRCSDFVGQHSVTSSLTTKATGRGYPSPAGYRPARPTGVDASDIGIAA